MSGEWRETTLGSVVELKRGYDLPKRKREPGTVPIISSSGESDTHSEAKVNGPGVVTGRYGTIGHVFFSQEDFWPLNTTLYVRDFKGNDEKFIYYFLKTIDYLQYSDKAAVPGVNRNHLHLAEVRVPTLIKEQKAIAHILGTLDDKIELNRQINATLEAIAQTLFKSWFVNFDPVIDNALAAGNPIPEPLQKRAEARKALGDKRKPLPEAIRNQFCDRFIFNDDLGWVPDEWKVSPLDSIINLIGGGTPKTSVEEYWNGEIPWFSVVDAPNQSDVFVLDTEKHVTSEGIENSSAKLLPVGTTIISARGTVGKCAVAGTPMAMNQSCYGIRGEEGYGDYFTYYTVRLRVADLQQRSHGSVFSTITRNTFRSIQTVACPPGLSLSFDKTVSEFMFKIMLNLQENQELEQLRDILLPKLLSGQLRIPEAEKLVAEVV